MTCRELIETLGDYVEGELTPSQLAAVRVHLGVCPDCADFLYGYRETIALGQGALRDASPRGAEAEVPDALVERILDALARSGAGRKR